MPGVPVVVQDIDFPQTRNKYVTTIWMYFSMCSAAQRSHNTSIVGILHTGTICIPKYDTWLHIRPKLNHLSHWVSKEEHKSPFPCGPVKTSFWWYKCPDVNIHYSTHKTNPSNTFGILTRVGTCLHSCWPTMLYRRQQVCIFKTAVSRKCLNIQIDQSFWIKI